MPINPLIASGGTPFDVSNALFQLGQGQRQDRAVSVAEERNALVDRRWQAQDEREQNALAKEAEREAQIDGLLGQFDESLAAKNYEAAAAIRRQVARLDPAFSKELDQYIPATEEELKFIKTPWGGQIGTLGGKKVTEWSPPQPQQYGPNRDIETANYILSLPEEQRPAALAALGRAPRGDAEGGGAGLNDRQRTGVDIKRQSLLNYAASLTGMPIGEIERVYEEEGGERLRALILERGKRPLQGSLARVVGHFPFGKTLVDAQNADLIAPRKSGGAGIAAIQNPSGPITGFDAASGEAQFPGADYPLETQADMVFLGLRDSEKMMGRPSRGGAARGQGGGDPLAQYAGQVIMQNGKRYQVIQGANGRHFAQELK
jgi:hypothetical protein